MCIVSPGKHLSGLYEFGDSTGFIDEDTAVTQRLGRRDAPGGACAGALGPVSACVTGPIGVDHRLPDPWHRARLGATPPTTGPVAGNPIAAAPGHRRTGGAGNGATEAGANSGAAACRRWDRPVGLDQPGPAGRRPRAAAVESLPG